MVKILAVDDDAFVLKLLARQLKSLGYDDVVCLQSSREALDFLGRKGSEVALVLLDLNMPDIDGIEFMRQIADSYSGRIIIISGEDQTVKAWSAKIGTAKNLKIVGQLSKPPRHDELAALIDSAIES